MERTWPKTSVLIATYNGAATLPIVLRAFADLQPPPGGWELVVVDNGSTDHTKQVVLEFVEQLPLRYVLEARRGKNVALNAGLPLVRGDLIVFTDDDDVPRPDWLVQLRQAADSQPGFTMFAGAILPIWEMEPPPWILEAIPLEAAYGLSDPGLLEGPVSSRKVFGGNSAYRAEVFRSARFNETVGPTRGDDYPMGSEHEFNLRLRSQGFQAWHCKRAVVEHLVKASNMEVRWLMARAIRSGRGWYRLEIHRELPHPPKRVLGVPGFIARELLRQGWHVARAHCLGGRSARIAARWRFNYMLGQAKEARQSR